MEYRHYTGRVNWDRRKHPPKPTLLAKCGSRVNQTFGDLSVVDCKRCLLIAAKELIKGLSKEIIKPVV